MILQVAHRNKAGMMKLHVCQCSICQLEAEHPDKELHRQMNLLFACLSHQQRRLYAAIEASRLGYGGRLKVAHMLGINPITITKGTKELTSPVRLSTKPSHRGIGTGRPTSEAKDPSLLIVMEQLLSCEAGADPQKEHKWIRSSAAHLAVQLKELGYTLDQSTVWRLLKRMGYSMRTNIRKRQGYAGNREKRDAQFAHIAEQRQVFVQQKLPVISVDTKKKELIGDFKRSGQSWCKDAEEVNEYDFPSFAICKAVPYGIYDVSKNQGFVYVGTSGNTSEFATDAIARWWEDEGKITYPEAKSILILSDGGGNNGHRVRAWRKYLQEKLSDGQNLTVTVCHYPTRCTRWNPIEGMLFTQISINWSGMPLRTLEMMLAYIRGTTTKKGLTVKAFLQEGVYKTGQKVSKKEMAALAIEHHTVCPEWNYTISPRPSAP